MLRWRQTEPLSNMSSPVRDGHWKCLIRGCVYSGNHKIQTAQHIADFGFNSVLLLVHYLLSFHLHKVLG